MALNLMLPARGHLFSCKGSSGAARFHPPSRHGDGRVAASCRCTTTRFRRIGILFGGFSDTGSGTQGARSSSHTSTSPIWLGEGHNVKIDLRWG